MMRERGGEKRRRRGEERETRKDETNYCTTSVKNNDESC
jgi:hypothetical protein